jgi:hypothetical protein
MVVPNGFSPPSGSLEITAIDGRYRFISEKLSYPLDLVNPPGGDIHINMPIVTKNTVLDIGRFPVSNQIKTAPFAQIHVEKFISHADRIHDTHLSLSVSSDPDKTTVKLPSHGHRLFLLPRSNLVDTSTPAYK